MNAGIPAVAGDTTNRLSTVREPPWQQLQRRLASAKVPAEGYAAGLTMARTQWRSAGIRGSWLTRARRGVMRDRADVDVR